MNEVEIRVSASDRVGRGFAAVRSKARAMIRSLAKDFGRDGGDAGGRMARGILGGLGKILTVGLKATAATAAGAFAAQFIGSAAAALASGATKLVQGLGAGLALLPAAAFTGVVAFGALKLAVSGVGDALSAGLSGDAEKFAEAMEGLSPAARGFAREVVGLKGPLDDLKATVQDNFFGQFPEKVSQLAERYLPLLEGTLGRVGTAMGIAVDEVAGFLTAPGVVQRLSSALLDSELAILNVTQGARSLVQALLPLVSVGASFLPQLTAGFEGSANELARFMQEAERTGDLHAFIQRGIDSIRSLIDTGAQVGRIFSNIGSIGETVWGAMGLQTGGVLDKVEQLTGRFDRFLQSAKGTKALADVFDTLGTVVGGFRDTIGRVAGILGDVFGPIMPQILEFVEALSRLKVAVLDTGLDALEPVLHGIGGVLGAVVLPALTGLANWLADNQPVLQGIGIAILTLLVPAFVAWAISAGAAALATLLAMAPLLLIGAAIAALAALVIIHFDTIKSAIAAAFNWVVENWPLLLAILTGPIGIAVLIITKNWDTIKDGARAAVRWISDRFNDLVGFIGGLPGRQARAAAGMFDWLWTSFKGPLNSVIRGWNGLSFKLPSFAGLKVAGQTVIPGWEGPTLSTPNIPQLARGGIRSGLALVGERGAELVDLGAGGRVHPNANTAQMARGMGGGVTVNLTVNVEGSIRSDRELIGLMRDELNHGGLRGAIRDIVGVAA